MKRILTIIGILLLLAAIAGGVHWLGTQPSLADNTTPGQTYTVATDTLIFAVKATGRLEAQTEVALGFETNGTVAEVLVERGQRVRTGEPLAKLDPAELELQLAQAEANLAQLQTSVRPEDIAAAEAAWHNAQANYDKVVAGARAEDIAAAEASLRGARASYDDLLAGLDDDEITVAAANLRSAEITLQNAQREYDKVAYADDIGESPQAAELERATIAYESALANYKLAVKGASDEQLIASWAQVEQAQAQLDKLVNGPTPEDIAMAQAQVDQARAQWEKLKNGPTPAELVVARAQVDQARLRLAKATLTAPIEGVITEVNIAVGEQPGVAAVILLADLSALHIDVPVDEIDLPAVAVGQPATITLDALPNDPLAGRVTAIAPAAIPSGSGVTSYEVTVTLANSPEQARVGMTANVGIETNRRENVLVIPVDLLQVDQSTGQTFVNKVSAKGQVEHAAVEVGLRSGPQIEILSGLAVGERVAVPVASEQPETVASGLGAGLLSRLRSMHDVANQAQSAP